MNKMTEGEFSFELWAHEIYMKCPEIIDFWSKSSDPFTRAKALLILKYAGGKDNGL
jgi:hypothetical protein